MLSSTPPPSTSQLLSSFEAGISGTLASVGAGPAAPRSGGSGGRSGSLTGRLRSASDLADRGIIERSEKGALRDLILNGDERLQSALDKFENGDASELEGLMRSGLLSKRTSLDLLEDLDLHFLQAAGIEHLTSAHDSGAPAAGPHPGAPGTGGPYGPYGSHGGDGGGGDAGSAGARGANLFGNLGGLIEASTETGSGGGGGGGFARPHAGSLWGGGLEGAHGGARPHSHSLAGGGVAAAGAGASSSSSSSSSSAAGLSVAAAGPSSSFGFGNGGLSSPAGGGGNVRPHSHSLAGDDGVPGGGREHSYSCSADSAASSLPGNLLGGGVGTRRELSLDDIDFLDEHDPLVEGWEGYDTGRSRAGSCSSVSSASAFAATGLSMSPGGTFVDQTGDIFSATFEGYPEELGAWGGDGGGGGGEGRKRNVLTLSRAAWNLAELTSQRNGGDGRLRRGQGGGSAVPVSYSATSGNGRKRRASWGDDDNRRHLRMDGSSFDDDDGDDDRDDGRGDRSDGGERGDRFVQNANPLSRAPFMLFACLCS